MLDVAISTEVKSAFQAQKKARGAVALTTAKERIEKLRRLRQGILDKREALVLAMGKDFRKSAAEVDVSEIFPVLSDIEHMIRHLKRWMRPHRVKTPLVFIGTTGEVRYEPRGVVLIMAPWNYPFGLLVAPLAAAIAAGNCAIVKPSEKTPHTAAVIHDLISSTFAPEEVACFVGGPEVAEALLAQPFDHFFFTGGGFIGRKVAHAAAEHLASVTLELGGKSPVVITEDADLEKAAERIAWGKLLNAGQSCVAPDYILVHRSRADAFIAALKADFTRFLGSDAKQNQGFARVVDERSYGRLTRLLDESVERGARIEVGGEHDAKERYIAPTVLSGVTADMSIMGEEIFGPILPVLPYDNLDEALALINERDKPLALYVFSTRRSTVERVLARTSAGASVVNDVVIHFGHLELPFGGVGPSGVGSYHGVYGFKAFSHERAVLRQWGPMSPAAMIYPPYNSKRFRLGLKLLSWLS